MTTPATATNHQTAAHSSAHNNNVFESKSLWNYSLSPGWTQEEVIVLKLALMKFGIGKWTRIEKSGVLPTKSIQQCYLQTQRLLGQQSLAEFMGLQVDMDEIYKENCAKQGVRKCGFLVNQGGKLAPEEKKRLIEVNRERYGLTEEEVADIKLPSAKHLVEIYEIGKITHPKSKMSTVEKLNHLIKLQAALENKLDLIRQGQIPQTPQTRLTSRPLGRVKIVPAAPTVTEGMDEEMVDEDSLVESRTGSGFQPIPPLSYTVGDTHADMNMGTAGVTTTEGGAGTSGDATQPEEQKTPVTTWTATSQSAQGTLGGAGCTTQGEQSEDEYESVT